MKRTFSVIELLFVLIIVGATIAFCVPRMIHAQQPGVGNVGGELQPYDPARLDHFVLSPAKLKLKVGQSVQLKVEAFDLKGESMAAPPLVWIPDEKDQQLPPLKCVAVKDGLVTAIRVGVCGVNAITKPLESLLLAVQPVEVVVTSGRAKRRQR